MNSLKLRRILILVHLYMASILAPIFVLVAITGALNLARVDGGVASTPIALPAGASLDYGSETIKADVENLLDEAGVDVKFEYIRSRGTTAFTRPTSRTFVEFKQTPDGLTATLQDPSLHYRLMELHKGHGPTLFRYYQIIAGICLFLVVFGGLVVGVLAKTYRRATIVSTIAGTLGFLGLAFLL